MKYTIGLDIGTTSIGWAVINEDKKRVENLGVRIFDAAENPKDGSSLAVPRRLARSTRRRLRRRKHRLERLRQLFVAQGLLQEEEVQDLFVGLVDYDPYALRAIAIQERISNTDLARILLHLAKRRGFKSNRKSELQDKDMGALLSSVENNRRIIKEENLTPGQYLNSLDVKRNKHGDYKNTLLRADLWDEAKKIMEKQRDLGNNVITESFIEKYLEIFSAQRSFAVPGAIEKLTGYCTFEKDDLRAPSAAYTSELFMALTKANSLIISDESAEACLTKEQISDVIHEVFRKKKVSFSDLRKILSLSDNATFNFLDYNQKSKAGELLSKENVEKATFMELKHYHKLRDLIIKDLGETAWLNLADNEETLDTIAYALTFRKSDEDIRNYLNGTEDGKYASQIIVPDQYIESVIKLSFSRTKNLSLKAMKKMIPFLYEGMRYDQAALAAGYHHSQIYKGEKQKLLPVFNLDEIRNPVVFRALCQCRKIINQLIQNYGSPYRIHIELARELSKSFTERKEIEKKQKENEADKTRAAEHFKELYNAVPKSGDILKWRLLKEQQGKCAYSMKTIDPYRILENGYVEIDHILPYSRTFDNSYMNKVLVLSEENRNKLNRTPFEYFGSDIEKWNQFEHWVESLPIARDKKQRLLRKKLDHSQAEEIKDRALNDTRYITRYLKNYIETHLQFSEGEGKKRVFTYKGQMTAYLRHRWGFAQKDRETDLHHALDAVLVGVMNDGMVKEIEFASKCKELYNKKVAGEYVDPETGEVLEEKYKNIKSTRLGEPWFDFRQEVEIRLSENPQYGLMHAKFNSYESDEIDNIKPIFISRMPFRKITGQAHMETVRGGKFLDQNLKVTKVSISTIKLKDLESMIGKETDPLTYNLIKERLLQHGDDPKKAFQEPLFKLKKDGSPGPEVKSIKLSSTFSAGVPVHEGAGVADNGKMIRVDIFKKGAKHYAIPVYVHHRLWERLPDKVIAPGKPFKDWPSIDDSYEFLFSFHKNDLIKLKFKGGEEIFGYYITIDSSIANLNIEDHLSKVKTRKALMSAEKVEKWNVDLLGNLSQVRKEERRELAKPVHRKQS